MAKNKFILPYFSAQYSHAVSFSSVNLTLNKASRLVPHKGNYLVNNSCIRKNTSRFIHINSFICNKTSLCKKQYYTIYKRLFKKSTEAVVETIKKVNKKKFSHGDEKINDFIKANAKKYSLPVTEMLKLPYHFNIEDYKVYSDQGLNRYEILAPGNKKNDQLFALSLIVKKKYKDLTIYKSYYAHYLQEYRRKDDGHPFMILYHTTAELLLGFDRFMGNFDDILREVHQHALKAVINYGKPYKVRSKELSQLFTFKILRQYMCMQRQVLKSYTRIQLIQKPLLETVAIGGQLHFCKKSNIFLQTIIFKFSTVFTIKNKRYDSFKFIIPLSIALNSNFELDDEMISRLHKKISSKKITIKVSS